jgi:16S rRNA (uracil1498-N3)-methyltransferase
VNLVLFEATEVAGPMPRSDPRAVHVLEVLRCQPGDSFDAGLIGGPRGRATLTEIHADCLGLAFAWGAVPSPPEDITLIAGMPRPQTARKILEEATALGVAAMHFAATGKSEAGYASSRLWSSGEWRRHLIAGAEQAFTTHLPLVTSGRSLTDVLDGLPDSGRRFGLDNYEAVGPLSATAIRLPVTLALGPERGWSANERDALRGSGFTLVHLGERVLRSETAAVAAIAIVKAKLGSM